MEAIKNVDQKITEEVHRGSQRDKVKIRQLQAEHKSLSASLANLHEDDGDTPKDKKDISAKEFKKQQEKLRKQKQKEFDDEQQRKKDLNIKKD